jgi:hypothetical protein
LAANLLVGCRCDSPADPPTRFIGTRTNVPHYDLVTRHAASAKIQDSCFHRVPVIAGTTNSIVIVLPESDLPLQHSSFRAISRSTAAAH